MLKDTGIIDALIIKTIFIKSASDPEEPEGMREEARACVRMWSAAQPLCGPGRKEGFGKLRRNSSNLSQHQIINIFLDAGHFSSIDIYMSCHILGLVSV